MGKEVKKKSTAKLFFKSFMKGMVVLLGIALLALGAYLGVMLYNGYGTKTAPPAPNSEVFKDGKVDPLLTAEPTEEVTESIYVSQFTTIDFGISINVINATDTSGLAGYWKEKLNDIGYTKIETSDCNYPLEKSKIVITEEGIAAELKEIFPKATWEVGKVTEEDIYGETEGVKVFIFIGSDYDEVPREE
ncbi:MAG: LytR C-terminal domain-containing protein [Eubacterium sp.]|nr:LytR C-terminal domain-containing protein [Eubacterium sp.]